MKQLLKKCLVMVVMFTTIESYSNSFTLKTNDQTKNVTTVSIDSVHEDSQFLIKDSNGLILYSEQIEEAGTYSKKFDLTNLPDAKYYFELDKQDEVRIVPFSVIANNAEILQAEEYSIIKPEVTSRNDYVYITKDSLNIQSMRIDVLYEGYDLAYTEKIKNVQSLNRVYDFSNSEKGNYLIVFSTQDRTFTNSINIE